ncbi:MAG: hypothetical protein S4CHLAM6_08270 [Chlamydiae bacterium]|nr:hypothetical protein [Chlamydiota bacterium]
MSVLQIVSWVFLAMGLLSTVIVYVDINMGRYQGMPIMNICWPITALYSGPLALFMYFKYGRSRKEKKHKHSDHAHLKNGAKTKPAWVHIYISSTHCGAGCGLADIVSEVMIYWAAITILGHTIWASYFIDYGFAFIFGFIFQYFNIAPMKPNLSTWQITKDAVKADVLSLTSFQLGMYGWLLAVHFIFNGALNASSPIYWFMMQIGLTIGLLATYPVNYWLIKTNIKQPCAH